MIAIGQPQTEATAIMHIKNNISKNNTHRLQVKKQAWVALRGRTVWNANQRLPTPRPVKFLARESNPHPFQQIKLCTAISVSDYPRNSQPITAKGLNQSRGTYKGNACAHTIYMGHDSQNACVSRVAPSPETLALFNKEHLFSFGLSECLNQSLVSHGNPLMGYSDNIPATNSHGGITSNTSDHRPT